MKQFVKIALLLIYVFFNAGLSYSMHYCGEDFQRINLYGESKTCCPSEKPMPGCCEDISNLELPNTDQQSVDALDFQTTSIEVVFVSTCLFNCNLITKESIIEYSDSSPPFRQSTPIYISNQVFLI